MMNLVVTSNLPFVVVTYDFVQVLSLGDYVDGHDDDLGGHIVDRRVPSRSETFAFANGRCKDGSYREKKRGEKR